MRCNLHGLSIGSLVPATQREPSLSLIFFIVRIRSVSTIKVSIFFFPRVKVLICLILYCLTNQVQACCMFKTIFRSSFSPKLVLIFLCLTLWRLRIQVQTCGFRLEKMGACQVSPPCKTFKLSGHREWNPVSFCLVVTHFHRHPRLLLNIFIGGWRRLMWLQIDLILNVEIC